VLCARETARAGNKVPFLPEAVVDALVGYELHAAGAGDLVLADVGGGGGGGSGGGHDGGHCYSSACSHENVDDGHGLDLFRAIRNGDEDFLGRVAAGAEAEEKWRWRVGRRVEEEEEERRRKAVVVVVVRGRKVERQSMVMKRTEQRVVVMYK